MKPLTITCSFALLLLIAACNDTPKEEVAAAKTDSSATTSVTPPGPVGPPETDSATAMRNYQEYGTPGDMHKMMAKWDGTWNASVTMWMKDGAPPITSTARAVNKMILNGLYQSSKVNGNMMGAPFEGMNTLGFDKHKKVFVSSWVDNMGSGIMNMQGPWDEATKSATLTGKMVDPASGKECDFKEIMKIVDDNNQVMEMYTYNPQGKEYKSMEIKYTRAR